MLTLAALGVAVPVTAGIAAAAVVAAATRKRHKPAKVSRGKTVIVGGGKMTKALSTCALVQDAVHRVILTESAPYWMTAHRFSSAVYRFAIVPEPEDEAYAAALAELAREEEADLFVPFPARSAACSMPRPQRICQPVAKLFTLRRIRSGSWTTSINSPKPPQRSVLPRPSPFASPTRRKSRRMISAVTPDNSS